MTILEGSVRKAGQRVRINAQLIDSRDGTHLWAGRYAPHTIVDQLKVKLLPEKKEGDRTDA